MQARSIKALIVDDNQDTCEVISDFLKEDNYRPTVVFDGRIALERIKREAYDVMILDYNLCGITGLAVLKKTHKLRPSLRTIMISACPDESIKAKAKELGAYAFLEKPFDIDGLVKVVKKTLNKGKGGIG